MHILEMEFADILILGSIKFYCHPDSYSKTNLTHYLKPNLISIILYTQAHSPHKSWRNFVKGLPKILHC